MKFDVVMFFIILVVAEIVGFVIAQIFVSPNGMFASGKIIEPRRRRNFRIGTAGFMFCVAVAAGLSTPTGTPAAAVAGAVGIAFLLIMAVWK